MLNFWRRALFFPFAIIFISLLLWGLFGKYTTISFICVIAVVLLIVHLRQLAKLERWLLEPELGNIPPGLGLWKDIFSSLKRAMRSQHEVHEKYTSALHQIEQASAALPEGVIILDDTGRIEWFNALAVEHFGLDGDRDIGTLITYLVRQPEFIQYLNTASFLEPLILRGARKDELVLSVKVVTYNLNKKLLISRDVTHIERIETMRRDFVANVSHELRTPLTVVNGFIETMQDMPKLDNEMSYRALVLMGEQTRRMEGLVNDLLTLSRLENTQNSMVEEVVELPSMMHQIHHEALALSSGNHIITLEIESSMNLQGNANELHSAFGNLVSNAIRYTPRGGKIVIRWQNRGNAEAMFSVSDSGIGIASEHIPRLTERFYRIDQSRSRETGGTGLGLAIVKHVVSRHQAQLEIVSEEGKGSTFSIAFPIKRLVQHAV